MAPYPRWPNGVDTDHRLIGVEVSDRVTIRIREVKDPLYDVNTRFHIVGSVEERWEVCTKIPYVSDERVMRTDDRQR